MREGPQKQSLRLNDGPGPIGPLIRPEFYLTEPPSAHKFNFSCNARLSPRFNAFLDHQTISVAEKCQPMWGADSSPVGRKQTVQETRHPQWLVILAFTSLGLILLGLVLYLSANPADEHVGAFSYSPLYRSLPGLGDTPERVYLNLDQWKSIDGLKLRYHGLDGPFLLIDVIIPQLDPQFAYSHRLAIKDAEKGFRLFNRAFTLDSVRQSRIRLKLADAAER